MDEKEKEVDRIKKLLDDAEWVWHCVLSPRYGTTPKTPSALELLMTALLLKQDRHHVKEEGGIIDTIIQLIEKNIEEEGDKYVGHGWHDANINLLKKIRKLKKLKDEGDSLLQKRKT